MGASVGGLEAPVIWIALEPDMKAATAAITTNEVLIEGLFSFSLLL